MTRTKPDNSLTLIVGAVSLMTAFLTHLPELISLSGEAALFPGMRLSDVMYEVAFTFLSLALLFFMNEKIFRFTDGKVHIGFWKALCSFILTWAVNSLLGKLFVLAHETSGLPAIDATLHHYLHPLRDLMMSCIVTGTGYLLHQYRVGRDVTLENERLRTENAVTRYEVLKNQLNPHMLFNSMNTLYSLIRESPERARDYVQELSKVMRYSLRDNNGHDVCLSDEMEFVSAYIYLMKTRYEDNLAFSIDISPQAMQLRLPPMAVQLLVENAVKHNEISRKNPLVVTIRTDGDFLTVSNPLRPRLTYGPGTGTGLENLSKRYALLYKKDITVREESGIFEVTLPLMPAAEQDRNDNKDDDKSTYHRG